MERPATAAKPHHYMLQVFGAATLCALVFGGWRIYVLQQQKAELEEAMSGDPFRMPEPPAEPPKEMAGILADETEAQIGGFEVEAKAPQMDPAAPVETLRLARDFPKAAEGLKNDPQTRSLAAEMEKDPEIQALMARFKGMKNPLAVAQALQSDPSLVQAFSKYMADPRFQRMLRKAQGGLDAAPEEAIVDPSAVSGAEPSFGTSAPPPPPPSRR